MILAAALCPHPPLLLRELTGGADAGATLRARCADAVRELLAHGADEVVVVGGADSAGSWPTDAEFEPAQFGGAAGAASGGGLPLSLGVGGRLLDEAGWTGSRLLRSVGWGDPAADCLALGAALAARPGHTALLVLGDGSARRGLKAPGHLDPRAAPFGAGVVEAIGRADVAALAGLDAALAADLMVAGRAAWQVLAGAASPPAPAPRGRVLYADDPFGVLYVVATWAFGSG